MDDITFLNAAERIVDTCYSREDLKRFDGFVPLVPEMYTGNEIIFSDATIEALNEPYSLSLFVPGKTKCDDQLMSIRKVPGRDVVKKTGRFYADLYSYSRQFITDKAFCLQDTYIQIGRGSRKTKIITPPGMVTNGRIANEIINATQAALGTAFWVENSFRVYIKPEEAEIGFTIPLETLAICKDLFRMRDIEAGAKRRKALKHFVAEHFRKKKNTDDLQKIKQYLRGADTFTWSGFRCQIKSPTNPF